MWWQNRYICVLKQYISTKLLLVLLVELVLEKYDIWYEYDYDYDWENCL